MRLLLILALLLSAVAMARPAPAEAAAAMADCHAAVADRGADDEAPADSADHLRALGHTCPGCAAVAPTFNVLSPILASAAPQLAKTGVWRPSIQSAPVPPPPQIA